MTDLCGVGMGVPRHTDAEIGQGNVAHIIDSIDDLLLVTPPGLEPGTNGLKVHCSAIELESLALYLRGVYATN